jgi:hypothetical protein
MVGCHLARGGPSAKVPRKRTLVHIVGRGVTGAVMTGRQNMKDAGTELSPMSFPFCCLLFSYLTAHASKQFTHSH